MVVVTLGVGLVLVAVEGLEVVVGRLEVVELVDPGRHWK
jgi:hypothetical protein